MHVSSAEQSCCHHKFCSYWYYVSFQQNCEYDSVRIVSGTSPDSVVNGVYCGSTLPMPITSEANTLRIEFNSDNSVQKTGFNARFFTGIIFLHALKVCFYPLLNAGPYLTVCSFQLI